MSNSRKDTRVKVYISEDELEILQKVLDIANDYLNDYCEGFGQYVLTEKEISEIKDIDDRQRASIVKYENDILNEAGCILEELSREVNCMRREESL